MSNFLWEILVPAWADSLDEFTLEHHKQWDAYVKALSGGLTIYKKSKGIWLSPNNEEFQEEMIPVRIACSPEDIAKISDFTAKHYRQQAIMYHLVSTETHIVHYDKNFERN
jgi:hypothetical protein